MDEIDVQKAFAFNGNTWYYMLNDVLKIVIWNGICLLRIIISYLNHVTICEKIIIVKIRISIEIIFSIWFEYLYHTTVGSIFFIK